MTKEEKQAIIDKAVNEAVAAQIRDDICSRSTMYGLQQAFDFIPDALVTASTGLLGGTASCSGSCGAFCAGLMAVGLKYNATMAEEAEDEEAFGRTAATFMEFREKFIAEMGSMMCPKIHKKLFGREFNLMEEADQVEFLNLPGHIEKCGETVGTAARIAAEMILRDE